MKKEIQGWCKLDISPHLMLLHSVDKILHVNANLSLSGNLPDERVLEKLVGIRALVVVFNQHRLDEVLKL